MSVGSISNNEGTYLLQPSNSNSADALATARALQILATGNFQAEPSMPQTAPIDGEIDASILERTAQIIKMSSSQSSSGSTSSEASVLEDRRELSLPDGEYIGDVLNGVPHGRGTLICHPGNDCSEYTGKWKNGKFHGEGMLTFANGDKMTGQWKAGFMYGKGCYEFESGSKYKGEFLKSMFHGMGIIRYVNGDVYNGDWRNNEKHGKGTMEFHDESYYTGGWAHNKYEGQGNYYSGDYENRYTGRWKNGLRHGQGVDQDGIYCKIGTFVNGRFMNGTWTGIGTNLTSGTCKDGVMHTSCCSYFCTIQ
jgi:hypothetical protein